MCLERATQLQKAKPAECPYTKTLEKINIKLACTGPGFPSTEIAPTEHFYEKNYEKLYEKKTSTHRFL